MIKQKSKYVKYIEWSALAIIVLIVTLILLFPDNEMTKKKAYSLCLKRAKECSQDIPAVQLQFMADCRDIYLYTNNSPEPLLELVNGFC